MHMKKKTLALTLSTSILGCSLLLAGCGSTPAAPSSNSNSSNTSSSSGSSSSKPTGGTYTIGLANSYIGNGWRVEMEHILEAYSKEAPYNKEVKLQVVNSGNSVSAQISTINNMIAAGVNAILVDAASPSGLNSVIAQAHQKGIPVIAFDNTVTSPYAYNIYLNQKQFGALGAQFLVKALNGKGNVLLNRGVAGTPVDIDRTAGAMSVFKKYPGIHVIDQINGNWDPAVSESQFANAIAAYPNINAVWSQGGTYGIIQELLKTNHKLMPMAGEASNGFRLALINPTYQKEGLTGISVGDPPALSAVALKSAVEILQGKKLPHTINVPIPVVTASQIKSGVNAFPNLPTSVFDDFTGVDGLTFTASQMQTGK